MTASPHSCPPWERRPVSTDNNNGSVQNLLFITVKRVKYGVPMDVVSRCSLLTGPRRLRFHVCEIPRNGYMDIPRAERGRESSLGSSIRTPYSVYEDASISFIFRHSTSHHPCPTDVGLLVHCYFHRHLAAPQTTKTLTRP